MNDIIIVEGKNKYTFSNKKEVIEQFLGKDFYQLNEDEKYKKIKLRTLMNSTFRGLSVKDITKGDLIENIEDPQYIILNEETFLLSLAKNNDIVIYEREDANQFASNISKEQLEKVNKDYIRVNDCANELLQEKIKNANLEI